MVDKRIAREWEYFYLETPCTELPWELGTPQKELVELIEDGIVKLGRALDICCGAGTQSEYMAQKGFDVFGIDISKRAIKYSVGKRCARCSFVVGDSVLLPFKDSVLGFVFDRGCFHHIPPPERDAFIRGVHRVLSAGGKYHLTCFSDREGSASNNFSKDDIKRYFGEYFFIKSIRPISFVDNTGFARHFYAALMEKKKEECK